jgi:hypothetical protein
MKRMGGTRGGAALIVAVGAMVMGAVGTSSGAVTRGPSIKTFSVIAKNAPNQKAKVALNVDGLLINARCGTGSNAGNPVVFAFSNVPAADLLGHMFDGAGRTHIIHNTQFNKGTKGVRISSTSSDFDGSGMVAFETSKGKVVTVNYAFDNATTLNKQNVCTFYGSYVAS